MPVGRQVLESMVHKARRARENAYAPYSGFSVGACVLGGSGSFYTGCNVENASYALTICAERAAIVRAITEGEKHILAVVIVAGKDAVPRPCGACLQVMREFALKDEPMQIMTCAGNGSCEVHGLGEYLPMPFVLEE